MEIYFINSDKFLENADSTFLDDYMEGRSFKCEKRRIEFALGRFLLKYVLKTRFKIENPQIVLKNKKPSLENDAVFFSLSHTKNIVMAVFDKKPAGIDIEVMKERNFEMIYRFWKKTPEKIEKKEFYRRWTEYEATVKLQQEPVSKLNAEIFEDFMLGICSSDSAEILSELEIFEILPPENATGAPSVNKCPLSLLKNPRVCNFSGN